MAATYEDLMLKARELKDSGDIEGAKRVASIAVSRRGQGATKAPDQEKSTWQTVKENIVGDDDPTTLNFGEKVGTALNKAGEAMTFGLVGDEASAAAAGVIPGGMNYDERLAFERQQEQNLERDNPALALGSEIGGSLIGALGPLGAVGTLGKGVGMLPRMGASAATGAAMGGTYGGMEGDGDLTKRMNDAATGATIGGIVGGAAPVVAGGVKKLADSLVGNRAIARAAKGAPSTSALRNEGSAAYQAIDDAGVQIKPQAFGSAHQRIVDSLRNNTGFDELPGPGSLTPKAARVNQIMGKASDEMATDPTAALPFKSLDQMRRQAGAAAGDVANKTDQAAGMEIINGLDDFVKALGPDDVVAGDVNALKSAIPKARDLWSRMSRSQKLDDAISQEENYMSGGASAIRNRFASLLRNEKTARGFSAAEKKAMQNVVRGSLPKVILDYLGSGLGMSSQIGIGAIGGGLPGAALGVATAGASRKASEAITRRQAEIARALVANGKLNNLPQSPEAVRQITESLMRRIGAAGPQ